MAMSDDDLLLPKKTSKVGQAVQDILSKAQPEVEVGEIISEYSNDYVKQMNIAVERGMRELKPPFYVVVLHKKEMWALNVMRNWFVTRQTKPLPKSMWERFPNFMHTVYEYTGSEIKLLWSLPSPSEAKVILKNWDLYHPQLVKWVRDALAGTLGHE
jgi:hypothetical protein